MTREEKKRMADLTLRGQCEEALRLLRAHDLARAAAVCRRILQTFPKHVETYSILGEVCLQMGNHEEAARLYQRVLSADPEHALAYASLAAIYEERGLLDEAVWHLARALELSPGNQEIRRELRRLRVAQGAPEGERVGMTRAALARTYLRGQLYPKAVGELRELVVAEPQRSDLRVALAEALWRDGQTTEAEQRCQLLLDELPNCLKANLILGQIWLSSQRDEEGRALLQRAQVLDPDNAAAQALFGARSPLPLRVARLPLRDDDAPPVQLPYLMESDEGVVESVVIEGQAATPASTEALVPVPAALGEEPPAPVEATVPLPAELGEAMPTVEEALAPVEAAAAAAAVSPMETAPLPLLPVEAAPPALAETPPGGEEPPEKVGEEGLSLLALQRRYVQEHPEDSETRLDLARWLRDIGETEQALEHYAHLVEHDAALLPDVQRDLAWMARLYPDHAPLAALLARARECATPPVAEATPPATTDAAQPSLHPQPFPSPKRLGEGKGAVKRP
jgi:tetratricopeptide (TPR) repeat protein